MLPTAYPVTKENLNYSGVAVAVVLIFSLGCAACAYVATVHMTRGMSWRACRHARSALHKATKQSSMACLPACLPARR